ncbi:hypothetical protein K9N68_18515 [Kovacikia minuta CCNUW1]|uniref:hypothetical protein n=1 Tax=Kovacikia minuta TaxID=2931930 RepID=UPI001CD002DD|nr:hypothetical protein [Kovacikia minuta]UBF23756.1 hypothetical protein K9N68_18515 [Kovacikia minuta CCNUW1]
MGRRAREDFPIWRVKGGYGWGDRPGGWLESDHLCLHTSNMMKGAGKVAGGRWQVVGGRK